MKEGLQKKAEAPVLPNGWNTGLLIFESFLFVFCYRWQFIISLAFSVVPYFSLIFLLPW
jgi:hypothetical protein